MKWFSVSNHIIFRFKSGIILNYVSNCSWASSIVGQKASKPIILELEPEVGRDRLTIGAISNSLWSNKYAFLKRVFVQMNFIYQRTKYIYVMQ